MKKAWKILAHFLDHLTILSLSVSTHGIWLGLLGLEFGLQFRHSYHDAPYASVDLVFCDVYASWRGVKIRRVCDWGWRSGTPRLFIAWWDFPRAYDSRKLAKENA